jgi:prephenate dehydrogenase
MKISIVGLGLIGGSIAQGLKSKHQITGFDPDKNTQDQATKSGINIASDLKTCVKPCRTSNCGSTYNTK